MATCSKTIRTVTAAALLLAGLTTSARGFTPGGGNSGVGAGGRRLTILTGTVLCAACHLAEVRQGQPDQHQLYQLMHEKGQVVMRVRTINNTPL